VKLDLVDTDSRSLLLLTYYHPGAPPYFHVPLSPGCLRQGCAVLLTARQWCHSSQNRL